MLLHFQNENYSNKSNIKGFYINQPTDMFNGRGTVKKNAAVKKGVTNNTLNLISFIFFQTLYESIVPAAEEQDHP